MDPIKEAFSKIKQDILEIKLQIESLNQQIENIKRTSDSNSPTENPIQQTNQQVNPTIQHIPTDNLPLYSLKSQFSDISTGNGGVPTNRQTDSQADQQTDKKQDFYTENSSNSPNLPLERKVDDSNRLKTDAISQIERVSQVLDSLDSIKKEVRSTFKRLTSQEMSVFSAIYTFEEQGFVVDYSLISQKLSLSESSIRDYVHKLIKKDVPILKLKENNKKVTLVISPELKKIASLQAILSLRQI